MDNNNITLKDIINLIEHGIEMAGWFKDFTFINMHSNGFIIAKIHYNVDLDAQFTMINMNDSGYIISYKETLQELGDIITILEHEYNQNIDIEYTTKEELNKMSEKLMSRKVRNPLELSTVIIKGCDDLWLQFFFEGKIYTTDYDVMYGKIIKEKYLDRWELGIRELAMHHTLDSCVDHMLIWFGA